MEQRVAAIVPLKWSSRRVPGKNFLALGEKPLAHHVFENLLGTREVDDVYCFSSDANMLNALPAGVRWLQRDERLDGDEIEADELFLDAVRKCPAPYIVLAQAPGPFVKADTFKLAASLLTQQIADSVFSAQRVQTYTWFEGQPLNYWPASIPQTQTVSPVWAETSGLYAFSRSGYLSSGTRIHGRCAAIEVTPREAVDIDTPADLALAQAWISVPDPVTRLDQYFLMVVDLNSWNARNSGNCIQHVCFDLDGVLIDSLPLMEMAWSRVCSETGLDVAFSEYASNIGKPFFDILESLRIPRELWSVVAEVYGDASDEQSESIGIYPGILELLDALKSQGVMVSIATSKPRNRARAIVATRFEGLVDVVVCPEDVGPGKGKPHADSLILACHGVGVPIRESLYVGDMSSDWEAARNAHMRFCHADWGYESSIHAGTCVTSPTHLKKIVLSAGRNPSIAVPSV